jgi:hypothetical protein
VSRVIYRAIAAGLLIVTLWIAAPENLSAWLGYASAVFVGFMAGQEGGAA